jgi:hypothetical protein
MSCGRGWEWRVYVPSAVLRARGEAHIELGCILRLEMDDDNGPIPKGMTVQSIKSRTFAFEASTGESRHRRQ